MNLKRPLLIALLAVLLPFAGFSAADFILYNGKIVTVDDAFSMADAVAVEGSLITAVGDRQTVLRQRGPQTRMVDLQGKTVLPGLIDSHIHSRAAMTEFDHEIPQMDTIADVLAYVRQRASQLEPGQWIALSQVFITRLREQRYPTKAELDEAAPHHPVSFQTGPDEVLNSLGLKVSGIDRDFRLPPDEPGFVERDPATGEPTGMLRALRGRYTRLERPERTPKEEDYEERLKLLFRDYNATGITAVLDRNSDLAYVDRFQRLRDRGELTVRMRVSLGVPTQGPMETLVQGIREVGRHPLARGGDAMLRITSVKTYLDGGMLTGSAYMRRPWGVSEIYGITDPEYRGVLNIPYERLVPMVRAAAESGLQFTAHSVGDAAVHMLLDAYEEVGRALPIRDTRPSITHSNFMSRESIEKAARLGVVLDIQPSWLYMDARTLHQQFGDERLRYFQPLRSLFEAGVIAGGGTDHMQKIGSMRSVNPYNPFLSIWVTLTRKARWFEGSLNPAEALTREQALRFYTRNNAYILFLDDQIGSIETGKRADLIVIDRDILTCPIDDIPGTQVLSTYLDGRLVHQAE